ncbi:cytochrome P450 [Trematosphaeria pertusa]|uniref:Cytochrome P450 n=1 Tax=Trematosphaeria pertusa TaxID=390896 RepID=A0A6A6IFQ1_9PLEO|nr:cytochrome P450 [Trematosphaeria pertusa]KAF2249404.1 cytochrome P450 [Trematosphaeria pertusa]
MSSSIDGTDDHVFVRHSPIFRLAVTGALMILLSKTVYNLLFHPLADFPGPFLGRASLFWRFQHTAGGKIHIAIEELHRQYGPIVRISPNELSFASVESWRVIYGHASPGKEVMRKSPFYDIYGSGFRHSCIGSERDPKKHGNMRRMLSAAFSQRALLEQEAIVASTIDRFVEVLGEQMKSGTEALNMTKWYEMVSFDILGEMAFGESFHSIETGQPHFWSDLILEHLYFITLIDNLSRLPFAATIFRTLFPSTLIAKNRNSEFSRKQVERRLNSQSLRKDFLTHLVQKVRDGEVQREEMTAHVSTLAIAGGETVSTFLAGTTFFLLKKPSAMEKLSSEIRNAFPSYEAINAQKAQQLPYLQAVIHEGLRMYPPGSQGFPRVSTGFELHSRYIPPGAEVYTSAWAVTHDPEYWDSPMEFVPERWLESKSQDMREASQPFSLGPRGCLGRNFAYMEMFLLLAKMLWKYDLELVNKNMDWLKEGKVYVMWWKPKLMVRFHPRNDV